MHAIRGLRFEITETFYKWTDGYTNSVFCEIPQSEERANEMALHVMLELDYTTPSQIEALSWLETSPTLKQFVEAQKAQPEHVLHSIFHGPTAPFIEVLLVKLGDIEMASYPLPLSVQKGI